MFKRIGIITAFLLFLSGAAFANDCGNHKDHGKGNPACGDSGSTGAPVTNINTASSSSDSTSSSSSNATGGNASATGGDSTATQSQTAAGGNASATNGGQSNTQITNQVRQAPSAVAPDAYPSAPCRVSGSAGASSPFGGVSFGGSKLDDQCDKRETARSFALMGQTEAAIRILCTTKAAVQAKPAVCQESSTPAAVHPDALSAPASLPEPATASQIHGSPIVGIVVPAPQTDAVSLGEYARALKAKAGSAK